MTITAFIIKMARKLAHDRIKERRRRISKLCRKICGNYIVDGRYRITRGYVRLADR